MKTLIEGVREKLVENGMDNCLATEIVRHEAGGQEIWYKTRSIIGHSLYDKFVGRTSKRLGEKFLTDY